MVSEGSTFAFDQNELHLIRIWKEGEPSNIQVIVRKTLWAEGTSQVKVLLWMRKIEDEHTLNNFQIPIGFPTVDYL